MRAMLATLPLTLGAIGLVMLVAAGPAYRTGSVPLLAAFGASALGVLLGVAATALGTAGAVLAARQGQAVPMAAVAGLLLGAIAWGVPARIILAARGTPAIHDISTDLSNSPTYSAVVPLRQGAANTLDVNADTAAEQRRAYPDIGPVTVPGTPGEVFVRALDAARDSGWAIVEANTTAGRIEATDTTRWFEFKDDVVVRLTASESGSEGSTESNTGSSTRVDVRSVSRVGRGDLGTNAQRIRDYLARLQSR